MDESKDIDLTHVSTDDLVEEIKRRESEVQDVIDKLVEFVESDDESDDDDN